MALADGLPEDLSLAMRRWSGAFDNVSDLEQEIAVIDGKRAALHERLCIARNEQENCANAVREMLADVDDTPENMAEVKAVMAPFLGDAGFRMVVS